MNSAMWIELTESDGRRIMRPVRDIKQIQQSDTGRAQIKFSDGIIKNTGLDYDECRKRLTPLVTVISLD